MTINEDEKFHKFIEVINKYTEISIALIDSKWEWYWRCKESEGVFDTPEAAITDCIKFICRDCENLLVASLAEDESIGVDLDEGPKKVQ